jgi:hypothetical protein
MAIQQATGKVKVTFGQSLKMLGPYAWKKVLDQIKSVSLIVLYLIFFQILILGVPIANALIVAVGIGIVIIGLAFFMEGLFLGLMPLGETCGVKLPQKTVLPVILAFAFILGVGATFAEPAIGVLKTAGASVKAWNAPLLFLMLNKYSFYLVIAVGVGVGIAVLFGMLRFIYNWSLKPFIYIIYAIGGGLSIWAFFNSNLFNITGLAWDCGAVTTGPVTVPLVLALGIGISRAASKRDPQSEGAGGGFGVVTLASAFPILSVMGLGMLLMGNVPQPMDDVSFFGAENRGKVETLFGSADEMKGYALKNASREAQLALFDGSNDAVLAFVSQVSEDAELRKTAFGGDEAFRTWLMKGASTEMQLAVHKTIDNVKREIVAAATAPAARFDVLGVITRNALGALQAILPLSVFLILVLLLVLRERLKRADETVLGIIFALIGMLLFSMGIEMGLSRLGSDVGTKLPSSFKAIEIPEQAQVISNFDPTIVSRAVTPEGGVEEFFYQKTRSTYSAVPYSPSNYDPATGHYAFTPERGPLFGFVGGIIMVLFFAFMMGYGATLAEPALNALGATVEELTVGTFKKSLLMQSVAIGVGIGITVGVLKIIFDIPLVWLLVPPYSVLIVMTVLSSEDYVNIGWDSAGVTTGPVTVPLVLAMGLGVGSQVGVVEGFGILALASAYPILCVLTVGLLVTRKRRLALKEAAAQKA